MQLLSTNVCFGGEHRRYQHHSAALDCDMEFAVYLPPVAVGSNPQKVPVLYWLSGLTCTDQNFMQKAGAQKKAAQLGIAIVCPDTSPRGLDLPGEHDSYDFGSGAGFPERHTPTLGPSLSNVRLCGEGIAATGGRPLAGDRGSQYQWSFHGWSRGTDRGAEESRAVQIRVCFCADCQPQRVPLGSKDRKSVV